MRISRNAGKSITKKTPRCNPMNGQLSYSVSAGCCFSYYVQRASRVEICKEFPPLKFRRGGRLGRVKTWKGRDGWLQGSIPPASLGLVSSTPQKVQSTMLAICKCLKLCKLGVVVFNELYSCKGAQFICLSFVPAASLDQVPNATFTKTFLHVFGHRCSCVLGDFFKMNTILSRRHLYDAFSKCICASRNWR